MYHKELQYSPKCFIVGFHKILIGCNSHNHVHDHSKLLLEMELVFTSSPSSFFDQFCNYLKEIVYPVSAHAAADMFLDRSFFSSLILLTYFTMLQDLICPIYFLVLVMFIGMMMDLKRTCIFKPQQSRFWPWMGGGDG